MKTIKKMLLYYIPFLFLPSLVMAQSYNYGYHMGSWDLLFLPFSIISGLVMLIFWLLIIVGVIYLVKYIIIHSKEPGKFFEKDQALDIIRERYAKGEITKEEYERMKEDLKK